MSPKDIRPQNDMQALERRLETLELTLGELVAIHRRLEQLFCRVLE
jgi:hypothetical protein